MERRFNLASVLIVALVIALATSLYFGKKQQDYSKRLEKQLVLQDTAINQAYRILKTHEEYDDSIDAELFAAIEKNYTLQVEVDKSRAVVVANGDSTKKYIKLYRKAQLDLDTAQMLLDGNTAINECEELWESMVIHFAKDDSAKIAQMESDFQKDKIIDTLRSQNKRIAVGYAECLVKAQQANLDLIAAKSRKKQTIWTRMRDWVIGAGAGYALRAATAK